MFSFTPAGPSFTGRSSGSAYREAQFPSQPIHGEQGSDRKSGFERAGRGLAKPANERRVCALWHIPQRGVVASFTYQRTANPTLLHLMRRLIWITLDRNSDLVHVFLYPISIRIYRIRARRPNQRAPGISPPRFSGSYGFGPLGERRAPDTPLPCCVPVSFGCSPQDAPVSQR